MTAKKDREHEPLLVIKLRGHTDPMRVYVDTYAKQITGFLPIYSPYRMDENETRYVNRDDIESITVKDTMQPWIYNFFGEPKE